MNALLLYCKERVVPWEACKARPCKSQSCLFTRAVKKFGTDQLGLKEAKRYAAVNAMLDDKERLIEEGKEIKIEPQKILRTAVIASPDDRAMILPNDVLKESIEKRNVC